MREALKVFPSFQSSHMTSDKIIKQAILALGIKSLNRMQLDVIDRWRQSISDMVVLSPTGSGKSLAFLVPILSLLKDSSKFTQAIVIAPTREIVMQTVDVAKKIAPLTSITCCYGGHDAATEARTLDSNPKIIMATPGRLLDHINRKNIDLTSLSFIVIDEFDKCLELGFAQEMQHIMGHCPANARMILTSATAIDNMPEFMKLKNCLIIDHLSDNELNTEKRITMWCVKASDNNKLNTLLRLLYTIDDEPTIVFTSTRERAQEVYNFLKGEKMNSVLYHGALQQLEREKAVAMFENGSSMVMVATDLAARGLDIVTVKHIIHCDLPLSQEIFIHRNGRTARVHAHGNSYIITSQGERIPNYISSCKELTLNPQSPCHTKETTLATLHISAGKKQKVSKGDIVGFLVSHATMLTADEIGKINIFDHHSLVAVPKAKAADIINAASSFKLKKVKVKVSQARPRLRFAK